MRQALRLIETSENDTSVAKEEEILDFYAYSASKVRKLSVFNTSYVYFCQKFNSFFYTLIKLGYLKFAIKLSERILKISKVLFFSVFVHKLNTIKSFLCFFLSDSKKRPKS